MTSRITLRVAERGDCDRVFAYNFAPAARTHSRCPALVTFTEHERWFVQRLAEPAPIWIVEENGRSVGVIRIDAAGQISIALESTVRGRGVGRRALALACASWARPLTAEIHEANSASRACFDACGFRCVGKHEWFEQYQWSP